MEYKYDAFISYRHSGADQAVAAKLQRLLEARKKADGTKLSIFRDNTELSASPSLGSTLHEALDQSRYLILICSPDYLNSTWCMDELDYFRRIRGGSDSILILLSEGDPDELFPKILQSREEAVHGENGSPPLAANVCGETTRARLRKLRVEYLRIAAPLLGVSFDQLYQRAQRRQIVLLSWVIAALFAFLLYSAFLITQITRRQNMLEAKQQELYQTESIRLANEAMLLLEEDPALARLLAYTALPGDLQAPDYPLTREADISIRTTALQHMYTEAAEPFTPVARISFPNTDWTFGMFFDNGNYFSVVDGQQTLLYQAHTGMLIGTFPSKEIFFFDGMERCVYYGSAMLEDGTHWYGYFVCDVRTGEVLRRVERPVQPEGFPQLEYERDTGKLWIVYSTWHDPLGPPPADEVHWDTAYGWFDREGIFHEDHSVPEVRGSFVTVYYRTRSDDVFYSNYTWEPELSDHIFWDNMPEGFSGFQEENTELFYRVSDYEILIYEVNPENLDLPQTAPLFDHVSDNGRYGFGVYTTMWDSERTWSMFAYDTAELNDVVYINEWTDGVDLPGKGNYQYASPTYHCYDVTPDGTRLVIAETENSIAYVDVSSGETLFRINTEDLEVFDIAVSEDGSLFVFATDLGGTTALVLVDANAREYAGVKSLGPADQWDNIHLELRGDLLLATPSLSQAIWLHSVEEFDREPQKIELQYEFTTFSLPPGTPLLAEDGLLIIPSYISSKYWPEPTTVQKIIDIETGEEIGFTSFYSNRDLTYSYDAAGGNLITQLVDDVYVQRRGESGDFEVVYTITSQHEGMKMNSAGHASDGTWLVLQNEEYCEIYRLEDGVLCYTLRKNADRNSQFGVIDGRLYDFCLGWDQVSIPLPDTAEAQAYIRDVLSSGGSRRSLTDGEMADYYVPSHWREK